MCDEWMPTIELPISIDQFHQLPRNPAYKYEFLGGRAFLSPRPKHYHAMLDLQPFTATSLEKVTIQSILAERLHELDGPFSWSFHDIQPFGSIDDAERRVAAVKSLERVRTGGDGPLIEQASFVAYEDNQIVGAILITLLPDKDPCEWDSFAWKEEPPADCIEQRLGRPHLTWIFVTPFYSGHGVGTFLLSASVRELLEMGYKQLASTFMRGNDSSMLWHWRNGFRLLAYPGSKRRMSDRWKNVIDEIHAKE
jgi:GNAT superfamily N-acetyltransferase